MMLRWRHSQEISECSDLGISPDMSAQVKYWHENESASIEAFA